MQKFYIINTKNIKNYLSGLNEQDPERTWGNIDLLLENIQNNLFNILGGSDKIVIEVDYEKKEVTLLGESLPSKNRKVILDKDVTLESIYNSVVSVIDTSNKIKTGNNLIKLIETKKI